jgi:hypothetical protein
MHRVAWMIVAVLPSLSSVDRDSDVSPEGLLPAPIVDRCLGRWVGTGRGSSGAAWSIDMRVTAERAARCGTIEYPSLGCGGYLADCRRVGDVVTWREVYTHNPGTCAPAGSIEGRCDGDTMRWRWTGAEVVRTRLRRAE